MPEVQDRYDFANGWTLVVDQVKDGEVYFQRLPPGVNDQSFVANLSRMSIYDFIVAVNTQREAEATHV